MRIQLFVLCSMLFGFVSAEQPQSQRTSTPQMAVGILLFDGVQIIDYTGPYEVFGQAGMKVWTASVDGKPITTGMGMRVTPTYSLNEAPAADIVVLPGGNVPHMIPNDDPRIIWILKMSEQAKAVFSVCNGVFFLSSAGLLDDQRATTYALMLDHLQMSSPKVKVVSEERVVDNGKIVTAGGLSAGIDGALHLVSKYLGKARAQMVANNMEYDWRPDREYNRAKLADVHIHKVIEFFPPMNRRIDEIYEGDADEWHLRWRIQWAKPIDEMRRQFLDLAKEAGWRSQDDLANMNWKDSTWTFADHREQKWKANVAMQDQNEEILLEIHITKYNHKNEN